jgi:hypothetical protein
VGAWALGKMGLSQMAKVSKVEKEPDLEGQASLKVLLETKHVSQELKGNEPVKKLKCRI